MGITLQQQDTAARISWKHNKSQEVVPTFLVSFSQPLFFPESLLRMTHLLTALNLFAKNLLCTKFEKI